MAFLTGCVGLVHWAGSQGEQRWTVTYTEDFASPGWGWEGGQAGLKGILELPKATLLAPGCVMLQEGNRAPCPQQHQASLEGWPRGWSWG